MPLPPQEEAFLHYRIVVENMLNKAKNPKPNFK